MSEKLDKHKIEEKIINFLKQNVHGVTGSEIAKYLGMNRVTVAKYLDVLRAEGIIDYKQIGKTKIWFLNEDIAVLELLRSNREILKLIRRNPETNELYLAGEELKLLIIPYEFIADIYLESIKQFPSNYDKFLTNIGKRIGKHFAYMYEMYSGVKLETVPEKNLQSIFQQLTNFLMRFGWGILEELRLNTTKHELYASILHSRIVDVHTELEDPLMKKLEGKSICFLLSGFFAGLMEAVFDETFEAMETKCKFKGDEKCEFAIFPLKKLKKK